MVNDGTPENGGLDCASESSPIEYGQSWFGDNRLVGEGVLGARVEKNEICI